MRKASTRLLEQGIQAPSPAPDLILAVASTENLHCDWYSQRGPHGIHAIGQAWVNVHPDYVEQHGYTSCAYCHGSDHTGLFLSRAKVSRTFTVENGQKKSFNAGHNFNCYDCHNGPNGG